MKSFFPILLLASVLCLWLGAPILARAADSSINQIVESAWTPLKNFINSLERIDVKQVKQNIPFRVPLFDFRSRSGIADAPSRITLALRAILSFFEGIAGGVAAVIAAILKVIISIIQGVLSVVISSF